MKNINPTQKATVEPAKTVGVALTDTTASVNPAGSTPTTAETIPESKHQVTSTQSKEASKTVEDAVDLLSSESKPVTSSDADSTTSNVPANSEKGKMSEDKGLENKTMEGKEPANTGADLPMNQDPLQDLSSMKGKVGFHY